MEAVKNPLRLSNYVIYQSFSQKNENKTILYSLKTNKFIKLNHNSFRYIENSDFNNIPKNMTEELLDKGFLSRKSKKEELLEVLSQNSESDRNNNLYIAIQPTAYCNLGCNYCGQKHIKKNINNEISIKVISFIKNKLEKTNSKVFTLGLFGSEPLSALTEIILLSREIKKICEKRKIKFQSKIITNGTALTIRNMKFLKEEANCNFVEITLDGDKKYHDKRRYTKNKKPTFELIYRNIKKCLLEYDDVSFSLRCNVDQSNKNGIRPLIDRLSKDKILNKLSNIYFAPIHSWGNEAHLQAADQKEFSSWEIDWFIYLDGLGYRQQYLPKRKKSLCMSTQKNSYLIDPSGSIFGCTEVSLVPSYEVNGKNIHEIGNLKSSIPENNNNKFIDFNEDVKNKKFNCFDCELLPVCGGMCPKEWYEGRVPCPSIKFNIKERMFLTYLNSEIFND